MGSRTRQRRRRGVGMADPKGDHGGDNRDAGQGGGEREGRRTEEEGPGLEEVEVLAGGRTVSSEGRGEGVQGRRGEVGEMHLRVICVLGAHMTGASDGDTQAGVGGKERGQGLGGGQVQEGREVAALADASGGETGL